MLNIEEFCDSRELFDGHYVLLRPLSMDGATADVWLALDTNTVMGEVDVNEIARLHDDELEKIGLIVAIKIYRPQNALDIEGEQRFRDEYMIVFNCHHTNLIHPTHFSIFKETPYLVLPYCKLGSSELLVGNLLDPDSIWKYILDVASGLAYLHALNPPIIHQDIKPANILLDDTLHYAITDFGISSQKDGVHEFYEDENRSGTFAYMAPERFQEDAVPIPQSDVWAFGATLFELVTGRVPFGEKGGKEQMKSGKELPPINGLPQDIQRLIHACLAKEPGDRPSAEYIVEAAKARQFPLKPKKYIYALSAGVVAVMIAVCSYLLAKTGQDTPPVEPPRASLEDVYKQASAYLESGTPEMMLTGVRQMDSLSNENYIPAVYQMAYTYGWYSDAQSLRRKELLNVKVDKRGVPVEDKDVNKALGFFTKIIEKNDSMYPDVNAEANYRLAWYYLELVHDPQKAKEYLRQSKEWAVLSDNEQIITKVDKALNSFKDIDKTEK